MSTPRAPGLIQPSEHIPYSKNNRFDFIQGTAAYPTLTCSVWAGSGHVGKRITVVTFFRCSTVPVLDCCWMHPYGQISVKLHVIINVWQLSFKKMPLKCRLQNVRHISSASPRLTVCMTPGDDHLLLLWISLYILALLGIRSEATYSHSTKFLFGETVSHHGGIQDMMHKYY